MHVLNNSVYKIASYVNDWVRLQALRDNSSLKALSLINLSKALAKHLTLTLPVSTIIPTLLTSSEP